MKRLLFILICLPFFSLSQTDEFKDKMLSSIGLCSPTGKVMWMDGDSTSSYRMKLSSCSSSSVYKYSEQYYVCYSSMDWCGSRGCSVYLINYSDDKFSIYDYMFGDMWFEKGKVLFGEKFYSKCGHRIYLTKEIDIIDGSFEVVSIYDYSHEKDYTGASCEYDTYKKENFDYLNRN